MELTFTGMDLKDALREAKAFGCECRIARRTGEIVVDDKDGNRVRVNLRRKDAPRCLTTMLNRLQRDKANGFQTVIDQPVKQEVIPVVQSVETDLEDADDAVLQMETSEKPAEPVVVEAPKVVAKTSERLTDQLRQYREIQNALVETARTRLIDLVSEQKTVRQMMHDIDSEIASLVKELREVGVPVEVETLASTAVPRPPADVVEAKPGASEPMAVKLKRALMSRPNTWITGSFVRELIGVKEPNRNDVTIALAMLANHGDIERRGQRRGTQYRYVATTASAAA